MSDEPLHGDALVAGEVHADHRQPANWRAPGCPLGRGRGHLPLEPCCVEDQGTEPQRIEALSVKPLLPCAGGVDARMRKSAQAAFRRLVWEGTGLLGAEEIITKLSLVIVKSFFHRSTIHNFF